MKLTSSKNYFLTTLRIVINRSLSFPLLPTLQHENRELLNKVMKFIRSLTSVSGITAFL